MHQAPHVAPALLSVVSSPFLTSSILSFALLSSSSCWAFCMHPDLSLSVHHHLKSSGSSLLHCRISRTFRRCISNDISRRLRPVATYIIDSHYIVIDSAAFLFVRIYLYLFLGVLVLIYSPPLPLASSYSPTYLFQFHTRSSPGPMSVPSQSPTPPSVPPRMPVPFCFYLCSISLSPSRCSYIVCPLVRCRRVVLDRCKVA